MILTFRFRIKDATVGKYLDRHSRSVNFVWNYCCEIQRKVEACYKSGAPKRRWPSHFDLVKLTTGCAAELGLHSDTVGQICKQFAISRNAARHAPRFRASGGPKRALGWLPFIKRAVQLEGAHVVYLKRKFHFWKSRDIPGANKTGCFTQDARGRWYVCFQCEVADDLPTGNGEIGIDLGLKTLATCSNGDTVPALQHYRRYEAALAIAQRANNKRRVKAIHAKIANARKDQLHKASSKIAAENQLIVVGNVSAAQLAKTRMAKSVLDASWSMLRNMLEYKASRHRACFVEADERWTSATCSDCGAVSGPKGIAGLQIRHWDCSACWCSHDRDVNAARNILFVGAERRPPVEEILAL
jgi:IS605 OrfB family transposase